MLCLFFSFLSAQQSWRSPKGTERLAGFKKRLFIGNYNHVSYNHPLHIDLELYS